MKKKHIIITIVLIAVIGIAVMAVTIFTSADKNLKIIWKQPLTK
jgi:Flp pilus assembly protein CpaB